MEPHIVCKNCGEKTSTNFAYCQKCGTKIPIGKKTKQEQERDLVSSTQEKASIVWTPESKIPKQIEIKGITPKTFHKDISRKETKVKYQKYSKLISTDQKRLLLGSHQLTEVDLTPLQQCPQLQELNLRNNQLTKIDLTPLQRCPQLQELNLRNNQLTKIDLSPLQYCTQLQNLYMDDNVQLITVESLRSATWYKILEGGFPSYETYKQASKEGITEYSEWVFSEMTVSEFEDQILKAQKYRSQGYVSPECNFCIGGVCLVGGGFWLFLCLLQVLQEGSSNRDLIFLALFGLLPICIGLLTMLGKLRWRLTSD